MTVEAALPRPEIRLPSFQASPKERSLIDALLEEQRQLTAVEEFSRAHDRHEFTEPTYKKLLPATPLKPGQQFAFEVDLDKCSGCKACVTACHSLNGLDDDETWREVGMLISENPRQPARHVVTTACHHCVEPGCLHGCPVLAYEKDPLTGIVRHLDDQCIGCEYCVMMCPYEVPKYSEHRGIVRKCDMCSQRLAVGEAHACAQACPNEAIRITIVQQDVVRAEHRSSSSNTFLPSSPDPSITLPTTRFVSKQPLTSDLVPIDAAEVKPQPAHWPLVWMLVLTQLGVGAFVAAGFVPNEARGPLAALSLGATMAGLAASVFHLGRPSRAWRAFLGLRTSWLSREIVVFGLFAPIQAAWTILLVINPSHPLIVSTAPMHALVALVGVAGVGCSGMVYHQTRRAFWRGIRSIGSFLGTCAVLGLAATWAVAAFGQTPLPVVPVLLAITTALKVAGQMGILRHARNKFANLVWPKDEDFDAWSIAQSAMLMRNTLASTNRWRLACGLIGGVLLPLLGIFLSADFPRLAVTALVLCFVSELADRSLFFRAVVPPRMPGPV